MWKACIWRLVTEFPTLIQCRYRLCRKYEISSVSYIQFSRQFPRRDVGRTTSQEQRSSVRPLAKYKRFRPSKIPSSIVLHRKPHVNYFRFVLACLRTTSHAKKSKQVVVLIGQKKLHVCDGLKCKPVHLDDSFYEPISSPCDNYVRAQKEVEGQNMPVS